MKFANATNINRKSGVAERRDLRCASTPPSIQREHQLPTVRPEASNFAKTDTFSLGMGSKLL
jgi:hypothetical protein